MDEKSLGFIGGDEEKFFGIDERRFRRQKLVHTIIEVRKRRLLGDLGDDRIATLKDFLSRIPRAIVLVVMRLVS